MTMEVLIKFFVQNSSLILSLLSLGLAFWFSWSAKKDAKKAQQILDKINLAITGWQEKINASTIGVLDSMPQVIESRISLAKIETAKQLTQSIHEVVTNAKGGASGYTQEKTLKTLTDQLNSLFNSTESTDQSKE